MYNIVLKSEVYLSKDRYRPGRLVDKPGWGTKGEGVPVIGHVRVMGQSAQPSVKVHDVQTGGKGVQGKHHSGPEWPDGPVGDHRRCERGREGGDGASAFLKRGLWKQPKWDK